MLSSCLTPSSPSGAVRHTDTDEHPLHPPTQSPVPCRLRSTDRATNHAAAPTITSTTTVSIISTPILEPAARPVVASAWLRRDKPPSPFQPSFYQPIFLPFHLSTSPSFYQPIFLPIISYTVLSQISLFRFADSLKPLYPATTPPGTRPGSARTPGRSVPQVETAPTSTNCFPAWSRQSWPCTGRR